jgi:hypothetical protein
VNLVLTLASGAAGEKTLWDPTILGVLVVASAIGLFCGSVYLLLATNMGARLGFLVAAACVTGFMVLLSALWITTATPLNSPRGRLAHWEVVEVVGDLSESERAEIRTISQEGEPVNGEQLANLRPAVEAGLVVAAAEGEEEPPEQPFARFQRAADFLTDFEGADSFVRGGGSKNVLWHHPRLAAVQFCTTKRVELEPGQAPPPPACDPLVTPQFAVLEYDYGSLRQVPWVYFAVSLLLFGLSLLGLHWYEKDTRARRAATVAKA